MASKGNLEKLLQAKKDSILATADAEAAQVDVDAANDADNGDKVITVKELHNYIRKNVHDTTKILYSSLPQTPQLFTEKPDRVLLRLP